jgi:hypothetical protein
VRYGLNKQDGIELRKTEDVLQFNSALGYRKDTLTGTTPQNSISIPSSQMDMLKIQKFPYLNALPLYFLRTEYATKDKQITLLIPFTSKITMVLDQRLANQGAFGVKSTV